MEPGVRPHSAVPSRGSAFGSTTTALSASRLPPRALAIRHADRAAFRSEWSTLASCHRSRTGPEVRPVSAPVHVPERKAPFQLMPREEFFAWLDGRWQKEQAYGHTAELQSSLRMLKQSVLMQQQERARLEAAMQSPAANEAQAEDAKPWDPAYDEDDANYALDELPEMDEGMMRSVEPSDAFELLRAQQYELAAAAFLRGTQEEPKLYSQHAAGFRFAVQQLRWQDPRYAGRFNTRVERRTVHTANPIAKSYQLLVDSQTGQLVRPLQDKEKDMLKARVGYRTTKEDEAEEAERRRRRTKPRFDDGSDAREFDAAMDLMVDELQDILANTDDYGVAGLRAFMAARGVELVRIFRHYSTLDRASEAQMRIHAVEKAATISRTDFTNFCRDASLLPAPGTKPKLSPAAAERAASTEPAEPTEPAEAAAPRRLASGARRGGGGSEAAPPVDLSADTIATIFATTAKLAQLAGEGEVAATAEQSLAERARRRSHEADEKGARTPARPLAPAQAAHAPSAGGARQATARAASAPTASGLAVGSLPSARAEARSRAPASPAPASSGEAALVLHSFLSSLVRLARARYGAAEPVAAVFERCWEQHFAHSAAGGARPDDLLRQLLDSAPMTDLYYAYDTPLKPIFEYHARMLGKLASKWANGGGANASLSEQRARTRAAIRKWIANRGPTIGFAEWQLFWDACWATVEAHLGSVPEPQNGSGYASAAAGGASGGVGAGGGSGARERARSGGGGGERPRSSGTDPRDGLLPPAVLQRLFMAAQSEEVALLQRGSATVDSAAIDTLMTFKEFWEGLARGALELPTPLLLKLHVLNERALEVLRISGLDLASVGAEPGGAHGRAPAELLQPLSVPLSAQSLHTRMEVLLQTVLRAFAELWGPSARAQQAASLTVAHAGAGAGPRVGTPAGRARAAFELQLSASAGGHSPLKLREVRQAAERMRETLAVRSALGRAKLPSAVGAAAAEGGAGAGSCANGLLAWPPGCSAASSRSTSPQSARRMWTTLSLTSKVRIKRASSTAGSASELGSVETASSSELRKLQRQNTAARLAEAARHRSLVPTSLGSDGIGPVETPVEGRANSTGRQPAGSKVRPAPQARQPTGSIGPVAGVSAEAADSRKDGSADMLHRLQTVGQSTALGAARQPGLPLVVSGVDD